MWIMAVILRIMSIATRTIDGDNDYIDVLWAFIAEAFWATTPNSNIINDIWYFGIGITNHLANKKDWLHY